MSKFTPGPWHVEGYEFTRDLVGGTIVQKYTVMSVDFDESDKFGQLVANARLIAKAPEMYEALKKLMDRLDAHFGGTYDWREQEVARKLLSEIDQ